MGKSSRSAARASRQSIAALVEGRRAALGGLAATSMAGGLCEALFLVLVTRTAVAITDEADDFHLAGHRVTPGSAIAVGALLLAVRLGLATWAAAQGARLASGVIARMRRNLASAFLRASWPVQQEAPAGALQELLTTFTQRGGELINSLTLATTSGFNLLALLVVAVAVDPVGALVVILGVLVLGIPVRPLRRRVKLRARRSAGTGMAFATTLNEVSQLGLEFQVFHVQEEAEHRVGDLIDATAEADRQTTFARALVSPVYTTMAYAAVIGALVVVSASNTSSLTSLGTVMLVMLRSLGYGQGMQVAITAVAAALPFMHTLDERLAWYRRGRRHEGGQPVGHVGHLELVDVTFAYEPGKPVIEHLSLAIPSREVVGIIGPSGGGKSTLVQLLLGLREPQEGAITADGRPIRDLDREEWARRVTFVPQGAHLITGTVADNIRFLRDDVSQADVERAAALAHLTGDIEGFTDGYERQVGSRGDQLSGGQQQRLCIARALVEDPDVLILDEPTSALDVRSEHLIRQTLLQLKERMTIIVIAHRLSTLDICDRIMVIQDGHLKGFDTPTNLAATNEFYSEVLVLSGLR